MLFQDRCFSLSLSTVCHSWCLRYILSHSPLNQGTNPSLPVFCDINSFSPSLPVGTGNNPTLSASHHAKNIPFPFSKMHTSHSPPPLMSIILACLKHEQEHWTKTIFHPCENETAINPKAVLSSVEKPRNLTYWEWVFPQRVPAERRKLQIYSVIKITFFPLHFPLCGFFFPSAVVFYRPERSVPVS